MTESQGEAWPLGWRMQKEPLSRGEAKLLRAVRAAESRVTREWETGLGCYGEDPPSPAQTARILGSHKQLLMLSPGIYMGYRRK